MSWNKVSKNTTTYTKEPNTKINPYLLLQTGGYLLFQTGGKIKLTERFKEIFSKVVKVISSWSKVAKT